MNGSQSKLYITNGTRASIHLLSPMLTTHVQFNIEDHVASRIGRQRQKSVSLPYGTLYTTNFERDQSHAHVPVDDSQATMPLSMSIMMLYV